MSNKRLLENNIDRRLLEDGVSFRLLESQVTCSAPTLTGTRTVAYSSTMIGSGGTGPYTFALSSGSVPGLTVHNTGLIDGTPSTVGSFTIIVSITDNVGAQDSETFTIVITSPPITKSGVYTIVKNQRHDTLYTDLSNPNTPVTANSAIPNPYIETNLIGEDDNE